MSQNPRKTTWQNVPYQVCTKHPTEIVRWRCRMCARNLCVECMVHDALLSIMRCLKCGDKIVAISSFDDSPAPS